MTKANAEEQSMELANLSNLFGGGELADTMKEANKQLAESQGMSKGSSFLQRIQLYSGGTAVQKKLIESGNFGIPLSKDEIIDLGDSIDLLVIWRKAKAIDMSDTDNIIVSNDVNSKEFQRIVDMADNTKDSGCAYGPDYLVFERSTAAFYEYFAGNASGRVESSKINTYMPVTPDMIKNGLTKETEPRFSKPMTLKSKFTEKGRYTWYAPKAEDCLTPFAKLPTEKQINEELTRFLKKEDSGVETVPEDDARKKRSR